MIRHRREGHDDKHHGPHHHRRHANVELPWAVRAARLRQEEERTANQRLAVQIVGTEMLQRARAALAEVGDPGIERVELMAFLGTGFRCDEEAWGWVFDVSVEEGDARILLLHDGKTASEWVHDDADQFQRNQFTRHSVGEGAWAEHIGDHAFGPLRDAVVTRLHDLGAETAPLLKIRNPEAT